MILQYSGENIAINFRNMFEIWVSIDATSKALSVANILLILLNWCSRYNHCLFFKHSFEYEILQNVNTVDTKTTFQFHKRSIIL